MAEQYGLALFYKTQDAMTIEDAAKQQHMKVRIIPTPGKIYASCGFSLKYDLEEEPALQRLLEKEKIQCEGYYHAVKEGLTATYTQVKEIH